jgi:hypothetical protein
MTILPLPIENCEPSAAPIIASISHLKVSNMPIEDDDDKLSTEFEERLAYLEGLLPEILEHLRFFRRYKNVMKKRNKGGRASKIKPRRRQSV